MTSMKNVQFFAPHSPLYLSEWVRTGTPTPAPGRRNLGYQPPLSPHPSTLVFLHHIDYI